MKTILVTDRFGKAKKGQKETVTTTFDSTITDVWQRIQNVSTLVEICKPMAKFTPRKGEMPTTWTIGKNYDFNLFFYGFLPIGKHTIMIEEINELTHTIQSREHNFLVPVWNHPITMHSTTNNKAEYTDEIEVHAGILTNFVAWWTRLFYTHRQRKWKSILR